MKPDKCPKCQGDIWSVEYVLTDKYHYDGVSEWACKNSLKIEDTKPTCDYHVGRFCGQPLAPKEIEPPFCRGRAHPIHA